MDYSQQPSLISTPLGECWLKHADYKFSGEAYSKTRSINFFPLQLKLSACVRVNFGAGELCIYRRSFLKWTPSASAGFIDCSRWRAGAEGSMQKKNNNNSSPRNRKQSLISDWCGGRLCDLASEQVKLSIYLRVAKVFGVLVRLRRHYVKEHLRLLSTECSTIFLVALI